MSIRRRRRRERRARRRRLDVLHLALALAVPLILLAGLLAALSVGSCYIYIESDPAVGSPPSLHRTVPATNKSDR